MIIYQCNFVQLGGNRFKFCVFYSFFHYVLMNAEIRPLMGDIFTRDQFAQLFQIYILSIIYLLFSYPCCVNVATFPTINLFSAAQKYWTLNPFHVIINVPDWFYSYCYLSTNTQSCAATFGDIPDMQTSIPYSMHDVTNDADPG